LERTKNSVDTKSLGGEKEELIKTEEKETDQAGHAPNRIGTVHLKRAAGFRDKCWMGERKIK